MSSCEIHLDDYRGLYFPEKSVAGKVVCVFAKTENISGVKITLTGSEYTTWAEWKDGAKKRERPTQYEGNNELLIINSMLAQAGDVFHGRSEYPFIIELPAALPSTYNGKYGWIKYVLKATLDIPNHTPNEYINEKEIKIVALVNFNEIKNRLQLQPASYSEEKELRCCCCSGPVTMNVSLEKTAFVVGETVTVDVDVRNSSRTNISLVEAELGMTVISRVKTPAPDSKQDYELLAIGREPGVRSRSHGKYSFSLEIPQTSGIPNFQGCSLFDQRTTLKVTAYLLPIWYTDLQIPIRIIVGEVPIGQDLNVYQERILQQASYLLHTPKGSLESESEAQGPEGPPVAPPQHVILPSRIPSKSPDGIMNIYRPHLQPHPASPSFNLEFYPPPLGHIVLSPTFEEDGGGEIGEGGGGEGSAEIMATSGCESRK